MVVKCNKGCFDSKRARKYSPGDQDDVDPLEPLAMYFDFPPGTEVYHKIKGTRTTPNIETTRVVPSSEPETSELCPICKTYKGTKKQITMHMVACRKKVINDPAVDAAL